MFVASNVAFLIHLLFYSTLQRKQRMEKFLSRLEELDNYMDIIDDLDSQNEEIQRQIATLKRLQEKGEMAACEDWLPHSPSFAESTTPQPEHLEISGEADLPSEEHRSAQQFMRQRLMISQTLKSRNSIARLFDTSRTSLKEPEDNIANHEQTFHHPILNSLMALSHKFMKQFLIETNLQHAMGDERITSIVHPDSFLLHEDLIAYMKHDTDKEELLSKLKFLKKDDKATSYLLKLSSNYSTSELFSDPGQNNFDLSVHLTGRWLNYEHSDTSSAILAAPSPKYTSNVINSEDYIEKLDMIFGRYNLTTGPERNPTLLLQLAKLLVAGGECIPSFTVFEYLLDNLGAAKLYNYQSMVYNVLSDVESHKEALRSQVEPQPKAQLIDVIHEHPQFLASLLEYQTTREDHSMFQSLLLYFEIRSDVGNLSIVPSFSRAQVMNSLIPPTSSRKLMIELASVARVMETCVKIEDVYALDKVLNKLILNLCQTKDGIKVALNSSENQQFLASSPATSPFPFIFDERILLLLGNAYVTWTDKTRAKWILPHVEAFATSNKSSKLSTLIPKLHSVAGIAHLPTAHTERASSRLTRITRCDLFETKPQTSIPALA